MSGPKLNDVGVDVEWETELREVPTQFKGVYKRALTGTGYKVCVQAACLECQGWEGEVQQAIADCTCLGCPLFRVRPYQKRRGRA